jgi:ring-1,2-phenylacetyl-CoA epoxidase subunit PaaC
MSTNNYDDNYKLDNQSTGSPVHWPTNHLIPYTLHLADNSLILGHRNSEWCGHGPILEQDIALTNIALDLVGQARYLYQYAAKLINENPEATHFSFDVEAVTEDTLAYFRDNRQFKNCLLVEQPNGDWAQTVLRQFLFSAYQFPLYNALQKSTDKELAAIAEKAIKEVSYHLRWSGEWIIRMGDGTAESHHRLTQAFDELWMYTGELFIPSEEEKSLLANGISADLREVKEFWMGKVEQVFTNANLPLSHIRDQKATVFQKGGKEGKHSEWLGYILAEMQFVQRAYPGCEW